MEKQNYDKPAFKVHLIPLEASGNGCNIKATSAWAVCPVKDPEFPDIFPIIFSNESDGCVATSTDAVDQGRICYQIPQDGAGVVFWS